MTSVQVGFQCVQPSFERNLTFVIIRAEFRSNLFFVGNVVKKLFSSLCLIALNTSVFAQEVLTLEETLQRFNWNLDAAEITSQKIDDGLYVLFGPGGNIAVSIGEQGVLIVDDMFPEVVPKIEAKIKELGGGKIDFAINTHWHFDHAQGNLALGPGGTWIVAQTHSALKMREDNIINLAFMKMRQQAYPEEALPVISFDDRLRFHFNGGDIDLVHFGSAHTAGDVAVLFRNHNAVHFGDVFNNTGYPFVDVDGGGDIDGMIEFCSKVLDELNEDTVVIPGHGRVVGVSTLREYTNMLLEVRNRIANLIKDGKSLDEVVEAAPTIDFDAVYGGVGGPMGFIDRVYTSLVKTSEKGSKAE